MFSACIRTLTCKKIWPGGSVGGNSGDHAEEEGGGKISVEDIVHLFLPRGI